MILWGSFGYLSMNVSSIFLYISRAYYLFLLLASPYLVLFLSDSMADALFFMRILSFEIISCCTLSLPPTYIVLWPV